MCTETLAQAAYAGPRRLVTLLQSALPARTHGVCSDLPAPIAAVSQEEGTQRHGARGSLMCPIILRLFVHCAQVSTCLVCKHVSHFLGAAVSHAADEGLAGGGAVGTLAAATSTKNAPQPAGRRPLHGTPAAATPGLVAAVTPGSPHSTEPSGGASTAKKRKRKSASLFKIDTTGGASTKRGDPSFLYNLGL